MTLKIQRAADGGVVIFTLSGRMEREQVEQVQSLFESETEDHHIVLDLQDVDLVDRGAVRFLARCVADGIQLEKCPAYIREWIQRESGGN